MDVLSGQHCGMDALLCSRTISGRRVGTTVDEAIICLSDMKIKVAIPKAAVQARLNNDALNMAIEALRCSEIPNSSNTISRQKAIDEINERQRKLIYCFGFENDMVKIMDIAKSIITTIPSVQPEPKTGRWIYGEGDAGNDGYYCNACGNFFVPWIYEKFDIDFIRDFKFCPNCGADMRGDKHETD